MNNTTNSTTTISLSLLFLNDLLIHSVIDTQTYEAAKQKLIQSSEQSQTAMTA